MTEKQYRKADLQVKVTLSNIYTLAQNLRNEYNVQ